MRFIFNTFVVALAAFFSSFIMLLIALVTPLGPWIEPIVLLIGIALMRFSRLSFSNKNRELLVASAAASGIAGIAAVSCAFTLPTLFFLERGLYYEYAGHFFALASKIAILVLIAGAIAFMLNELWEKCFLNSKAPFPAVELMGELIVSQSDSALSNKISNKICLGGGVAFAWQALLFLFKAICRAHSTLALWPLLASLGFMSGTMLIAPLMVGLLAKQFLFNYVYAIFFISMKQESFFAALCSGIIFSGIFLYVVNLKIHKHFYPKNIFLNKSIEGKNKAIFLLLSLIVFSAFVIMLTGLSFSIKSIFYLACALLICAYQLSLIASQTGLAPLGRFAAFVMIPGIIFFSYTPLQITVVVALVELVGGLAVSILFGRKLAQLITMPRNIIIKYQVLGLIVSACALGLFVAILANKIVLGVEPFLAQRALARTMLIGISSFDLRVVLLGFLSGIMLHKFKINSVLVISGFLMQPLVIYPLVFGGLLSKYIYQVKNYYAVCAGVFAISSLLLLFQVILC